MPRKSVMSRKSLAEKMADAADFEREDKSELVKALRLQALAWRQVAMIGLVDKQKGVRMSQFLFFQTMPFVNSAVIEKFLNEHRDEAEKAGIAAGVFTE